MCHAWSLGISQGSKEYLFVVGILVNTASETLFIVINTMTQESYCMDLLKVRALENLNNRAES